MNSTRLWEWKIEKHEIQKIGFDGGPKADENWMSTGTLEVCGIARGPGDIDY